MSSETDICTFWLEQAGRFPLLPKCEVLRLSKIIQNPESSEVAREKAIEKLVRHNLKLIPGVAKSMVRSSRSFRDQSQSLVDLYQMGAIGLRRAAEKFDPQRGYAFSTYASPWIRQQIQRELYKMMSPIRVPENTIRDYYDYKKNENSEDVKPISQRKRIRLEDAFFAMNCKSLDSASEDDENLNRHELIPSKVYKEHKPRKTFDQIISKTFLNDFQKEILRMKYMQNYSAVQIAEELGESTSRVRDNLKQCIRKIRREGLV